jgi:Lon protease-like protein
MEYWPTSTEKTLTAVTLTEPELIVTKTADSSPTTHGAKYDPIKTDIVTLTGICRFAVKQELAVTTPYRQVRPGWDAFAADLYPASEDGLPDRSELILSLRTYAATHGLQADWSAVEDAPMETLVDALAAGCPFPAPEKQALLEAVSLADRARTLIALMAMSASGGDNGPVQ